MSQRLSILVFCLLALAVDSKHKNDPEFIKNLTKDQRSTFFGIAKNPGLSIQQKEDKLIQWADKNSLTEQYDEFRKNMTEHKAELSQNVTRVIDRLAAAKVEMDKVFADKSLTTTQQEEKINVLKKTYPQEVPTLFYIGKLFEHPKNETKRDDKSERRRGRH